MENRTTLDCYLIKDLLPSYIDGLCSKETQHAIEAHLSQCPACKTALEEMKAALPSAVSADVVKAHNKKPFRKLERRVFRRTLCVALAVLLLVVPLGTMCFFESLGWGGPSFSSVALQGKAVKAFSQLTGTGYRQPADAGIGFLGADTTEGSTDAADFVRRLDALTQEGLVIEKAYAPILQCYFIWPFAQTRFVVDTTAQKKSIAALEFAASAERSVSQKREDNAAWITAKAGIVFLRVTWQGEAYDVGVRVYYIDGMFYPTGIGAFAARAEKGNYPQHIFPPFPQNELPDWALRLHQAFNTVPQPKGALS